MELIKALEQLEGTFSILVLLPPARLADSISEALAFFSGRAVPGVLVSLSKPHAALMQQFQKIRLNAATIFVIDTAAGNASREANVLHVGSPSALTDIHIAISQFAHSVPGERFVVVDALNALRVYNADEDVARFVAALTTKSAALRLKTLVFAIRDQSIESLERTIYPFFEKVIELG